LVGNEMLQVGNFLVGCAQALGEGGDETARYGNFNGWVAPHKHVEFCFA